MKALFFSLVIFGLSSQASAQGIKEKKERAEVDNSIASSIVPAQKACGKNFKIAYDWKTIDAWKFEPAGASGDKASWIRQDHSGLIGGVNAALVSVCQDKDYKAALAKMSTITIRFLDDENSVKKESNGLVFITRPTRGMAEMDQEDIAEKLKSIL